MFTTNFQNRFIKVAEDCPAKKGEIPPQKKLEKTIAALQYEMLVKNPYQYTSDEVLFHCYLGKNGKNAAGKRERAQLQEQFFSKGLACLLASPLAKRYGWGIHYDNDMKIAIYGCETKEYSAFANDSSLTVKKAMRSSKSASCRF